VRSRMDYNANASRNKTPKHRDALYCIKEERRISEEIFENPHRRMGSKKRNRAGRKRRKEVNVMHRQPPKT